MGGWWFFGAPIPTLPAFFPWNKGCFDFHMSDEEKEPICLVYIGDGKFTQLYRDHNKPLTGSLLTSQYNGKSQGFWALLSQMSDTTEMLRSFPSWRRASSNMCPSGPTLETCLVVSLRLRPQRYMSNRQELACYLECECMYCMWICIDRDMIIADSANVRCMKRIHTQQGHSWWFWDVGLARSFQTDDSFTGRASWPTSWQML